MSKDAVAVATLLGSLLMVRVMAGPFMEQIRQFFQFCFASIRTGEVGMIESLFGQIFKQGLKTYLFMAGPFLLVTALLAISVTSSRPGSSSPLRLSSPNSTVSALCRASNGSFPCTLLWRPSRAS